jgi:hypothetical protein
MNSTGEKYGVSIDDKGKVSASEVYSEVYIKINDSESKKKIIIPSNVGKYLGMKVSANSYNANNATYRLFYIDFDNDYKDGAGTIYLKADYVETTGLTTSETYKESNVQKFNREYIAADENKTQARNAGVSWLLNSSNWTDYLDTTKGATAAYGAPSLEMWVRSYNQFLNAHSGLYNAKSTTPKEEAKTLAYNFNNTSGYYVGVSENVDSTGKDTSITSTSGSESLILASNNSEQTSQVQAQIGMYNPGSGKRYWLASPSDYGRSYVMFVGLYSYVSCNHYGTTGGVSALVSLQSEITLELVNE